MVYVYDFVYMFVIDPDFLNKMKAATIQFMEKSPNISDDKLDETARNFDKQIVQSKAFSLGNNLKNFFGGLVLDCLFGLIVCAIIKKPRPIFE